MNQHTLARSLGTSDAVVIGLGSMVGAGVFAAFAPAAAAAGSGVLVALVIAAFVAWCNATSSAQLAAQYPVSGGTYVYGRERLGPWWGFVAGWSFVIGKTASCAAMAMTFAAYAVPSPWQRPVAVGAVLGLAAVNYVGVTRTARVTRVVVSVVLVALAVCVAAAWSGADRGVAGDRLGDALDLGDLSWMGVLQAAGLLFFAFAGYARIATMGEEVRDPERTIPRAIVGALAGAVVIYAVVGATLLATLGASGLAESTAPVADAVRAGSWAWAEPVARIGAACAALGALLGLIAGVGRTSLAMAREGDLPAWLAAVHPRYQVPHHAELALAVVVSGIVLVADLRGAIGFSSFGVLLYYFVANVAAHTQDAGRRRYPRWLQVAGAALCVVLVATLPWRPVTVGVLVLAAGLAVRWFRLRGSPA
ncbi:transporter [Knoellia subterranea KCTC 19937]|uniref:Transporter n=2 Tax=Knoellia TaxID=136099 RepID=A0A0A0JN09_9MICO|nr:APC family permease [Knoellia subterranea]KGN38139.1 transporter [Knoellia subterranea KCTC 19937]